MREMGLFTRENSDSSGSKEEKMTEISIEQIPQQHELAELNKIGSAFNVALTRPAAAQKETKGEPVIYTSKENPECPRSKFLIRSRIEPKVFFANERTFLSWLNIAVLLIFVSLSLLTLQYVAGQDKTECTNLEIACRAGQVAGIITAPLAFLMMAYALWLYRKRTFQILRRDMVRIDDQFGPTVLTIMLIVVMALAYVLVLVGEFRSN
eukprot:TRINITY_DN4274_c0_g1_i1.p2 TRINITY_DN4274_c0_g1~~TRINITY_DN4274_c0_g1_i1.p2  ORF type:complete len:209 (-),score=24.34 TRINITY_DN4274_c0_g1_i1:610-1236(-)